MEMASVKEVFNAFRQNRREIELPLEQIKENLRPYSGKIVLYGAGSAGIAFLHCLTSSGIFPCCFADGDKEKREKLCEGLEVIAPVEIVKRFGRDALVIVTINTDGKRYCKDFKKELLVGGHQGVHKFLKECGCLNVIDYTYFRRCYQLFYGQTYNLPACSDVYLMLEKEDKIVAAFEMLEDDEARRTFLKLLEFRLLGDEVNIPVFPEEKMYFEYDLFSQIEDEVFVDCGACGGSSLTGFLESNRHRFAGYYGIEPDKANFDKLTEFISDLPENEQAKMKICHAAAHENNGTINFYVLGGPGTFQADGGPDEVQTVVIDSLLKGSRATYIKMNIEGSEVSALKGAKGTIRQFHPRMAIMGYHKTSDLWEVPLLIKEYDMSYHLSLRSYMRNVAFAYYAF